MVDYEEQTEKKLVRGTPGLSIHVSPYIAPLLEGRGRGREGIIGKNDLLGVFSAFFGALRVGYCLGYAQNANLHQYCYVTSRVSNVLEDRI
jgi:hypothetical protein